VWSLYNDLIAAIPTDLRVSDCLMGLHWILIRSASTGVVMTPREGESSIELAGKITDMPVRQLAGYVKSWNSFEASLGLAAINSALNTPERVESLAGCSMASLPQDPAFDRFTERICGKRVAVIGHFPKVESLAEICQLTVLERHPQQGDLPDPACEFVLPEQDLVFVTATTIANKTLPRLLELSRQALVVLVGPSTPLTPILFDYGVDVLAGTVVVQPQTLWRVVQEGAATKSSAMVARGSSWAEMSAARSPNPHHLPGKPTLGNSVVGESENDKVKMEGLTSSMGCV